MTWLITPQLKVLNGVPQETILGIPFGGGYFAGYISHTADSNPTHALIVAPRATGATGTGYTLTTNLAWKTATTTTSGTSSTFDGVANTAAMVTAGIADHPAAEFCKNLSIGGFTDWYLPSRYELDIAYFNLKPTTDSNGSTGINDYSVPKRLVNYTTSFPAKTTAALFNSSTESFEAGFHWSSTEQSASNARAIRFSDGLVTVTASKTTTYAVRAFRRIAL
jgi:hypothetical protein